MFVISSSLSIRDFVAIVDKNLFDREGVVGIEPMMVVLYWLHIANMIYYILTSIRCKIDFLR